MLSYNDKEISDTKKITIPLIKELSNQGKDGLIDIDKLVLDENNTPFVVKKDSFTKKENNYPVLFNTEPYILAHLIDLKRKNPKIKLYLKVMPFDYLVSVANLYGPPLQTILDKQLFKQKMQKSTFMIINDKTGVEISRIEFQFEQRDKEYILNMEMLEHDTSNSKFIHCLLNENRLVTHIDGSIFYYGDIYSDRLKNPFSFNKKIRKEKQFRVDGVLSNQELIHIGKKYFGLYCEYLKLKKIKEGSKCKSVVAISFDDVSPKIEKDKNIEYRKVDNRYKTTKNQKLVGILDLSDYPFLFIPQGEFNAIFLVHDYAPSLDVISAVDIAASLQDCTSRSPKMEKEIYVMKNTMKVCTLLSSEIKNIWESNIVFIGKNNAAFLADKGNEDPINTLKTLNKGEGVIKLYQIPKGYIHLFVGGNSDDDTRKAAQALSQWEKYKLKGTYIKVSGELDSLNVSYIN